MAEIIAVYGSPGSGKTTLSLKLAQEIYFTGRILPKNGRVFYLSYDTVTPSLAYLFPGRSNDLFSMGKLLEVVDLTSEDIYRYTVLPNGMKNFGILGYLAGEDRYTYASPDEYLVKRFLSVLSDTADVIVVDTTCDPANPMNIVVGQMATHILQLTDGGIKAAAYYTSSPVRDGAIKVANIRDRDLFLPLSDTDHYFDGGVDCLVPYSFPVAKQGITGELQKPVSDRKYRRAMQSILVRMFPQINKKGGKANEPESGRKGGS